MRELSLFSGAGGGLLGTKLLGFKHIGYVEYEPYCQKVILQRIRDGFLDSTPIFGDIRKFISEGYAESYQGMVDVITAGFPCQPFSVAGKRAGADDPRNMWPQTRDVLRIVRPKYFFGENVPGLLSSGYFETILNEIAEIGFDEIRWITLGASDVGAPHRRKRLWILAYSKSVGRRNGISEDIRETDRKGNSSRDGSEILAHSNQERLQGRINEELPERFRERIGPVCSWWDEDPADTFCFNGYDAGHGTGEICRECESTKVCGLSKWGLESRLGRVANGVAHRVDRLKAIGNGQVPLVVATAWKILTSEI